MHSTQCRANLEASINCLEDEEGLVTAALLALVLERAWIGGKDISHEHHDKLVKVNLPRVVLVHEGEGLQQPLVGCQHSRNLHCVPQLGYIQAARVILIQASKHLLQPCQALLLRRVQLSRHIGIALAHPLGQVVAASRGEEGGEGAES